MDIEYLFSKKFYIILLLLLNDVHAEWYDVEDKTKLAGITDSVTVTNSDNENKQAIEPIKARSQIECVLSCKSRYRIDDAFYSEDDTETDKRCFCLQKQKAENVIGEINKEKVGNLLQKNQDQFELGIRYSHSNSIISKHFFKFVNPIVSTDK